MRYRKDSKNVNVELKILPQNAQVLVVRCHESHSMSDLPAHAVAHVKIEKAFEVQNNIFLHKWNVTTLIKQGGGVIYCVFLL